MWRILALVAALLAPSLAQGQPVSFNGVTVGNSVAGPEIKAWVYKPSGAGPFPAVVLAHRAARADQAVYYPNAYHSFDVMARDRTVPGRPGRMHRLAYDSAAAPDAEARTRTFFERLLR